MKKFFKITGIIIGVLILLFSGAVFLKARAMVKAGEEKAERVERFQSTDSNEYMQYSIGYNKAGNYSEGFKYLDKAVEIDPKSHLGYRGYMKLRFLRDFDGALLDFDRLDSLTPNFNDAPRGENIDFLRGESYYGKKEYQKAIECFKLNIKNQTEDWADVQSFVYLGMCEYELGNYKNAIREFNRALKQSDKTTEAYFYLSKVYKASDSLQKAKAVLAKAKETLHYKRDDPYNEYLNEIYLEDIIEMEREIAR